jgi:hypothetical protein
MAERGTRDRMDDWVPVTVRLEVPATAMRHDIFGVTRQWSPSVRAHFQLDHEFAPIPVRPPRAERGRPEFASGERRLFIVRLWCDPAWVDELKGLAHVHHVTRDARVDRSPTSRARSACTASTARGSPDAASSSAWSTAASPRTAAPCASAASRRSRSRRERAT